MKYIDEFRDRHLIEKVARKIRKAADERRKYAFMEVCGTHTMNIFRFGLRRLFPDNIRLISGPGCPVCVTPNIFLDKAINLANLKDVIVATFGDMLKVPGSYSNLEKARAENGSVKAVYSTLDALEIARRNPAKEVVFLGVGFETTSPTVAQSILIAEKEGLRNYSVLSAHKTMPEALEVLVKDKSINIDGFLLPGHVSAVIGAAPYGFLARRYRKRCVIAGFEPLDIMQAVLMLIEQKAPKVEIEYKRIINKDGNALAKAAVRKVFEKSSSVWRGIGEVENSGLKIRKAYSDFDADVKFKFKLKPARERAGCICGDVLKGIKTPVECKLFAKVCNPENPVGSCMVSSEGTCAAYYRYNRVLVHS